jgi:hypothetical protein
MLRPRRPNQPLRQIIHQRLHSCRAPPPRRGHDMQRQRIALPVVQHAFEGAVAQVLPDQEVRLQGQAEAGAQGGEEDFGVVGLQ